jgi:hypothetical protein
LQSLGTGRGAIAARLVNGQGAIAALRTGLNVSIFSAPDMGSLRDLIESTIPATLKIDASDAEMPVPMYLDRWDKYGFRFYYCPLWKPEGVASYDPAQDFQFAHDSQHSGIVQWVAPVNEPLADGLLDFNSNAWVLQSSRNQHLPFGVNIGFGDSLGFLRMRLAADLAPNAPGYVGNWYGATNFGGGPTIAWSSDEAQDIILGQLKPLVQRLTSEDSVVNWLEPHEEMGRGITERLDDHGPVARRNFDQFLKETYGTPEAVATRWSEPGAFHRWADVPFPEVATFCGWDKDAIDLQGEWKVSYDASYGADSAQPGLDDSNWGTLEAPGDALVTYLPRKPAVFRRHIVIDSAWREAHRKVWLYCFDLNNTHPEGPTNNVLVFVNGRAISENPPRKTESHWATLEVSDALVDGANLITICLPQALLAYRVYLSGTAPASYPALGPRLNAMWADFTDWTAWSRGRAVRRGMQMIRQVDPDRPITLMTPDADMAPVRRAAQEYGGIVHDTGGMAGGWNDIQPVMAQSLGLATDCEPGSCAVDLDDFKRFMGRWETEGTNGVDYFQHLGQLEWKPAIKIYFTQTQNLWHLIGKYHEAPAELAVMDSDRVDRLMGFPWDWNQPVPNLVDDIRLWPILGRLAKEFPCGGVLEQDFRNGNADKFRIILDSGTTVLDPDVVEAIGEWVRRGGIFITNQQTGRHTSAIADAWPISKLTGYAVIGFDQLAPNGNGESPALRPLHAVAGQSVFDPSGPEWPSRSAGLSLKKTAPECQDLLQWEDGSIAAGMRKLGKGMVINLGSYSTGLADQVLMWLKVPRVPIVSSDPAVRARHFVSNNGLYDVWSFWNEKDSPTTVSFTFRGGYKPASCRDVITGTEVPLDADANGVRLSNIAFSPWETHAYLSPREQLDRAAADWFALQRGWWSGTEDPGKPVPVYHSRVCLDLTDDWACKLVPGDFVGTPPEDRSLAEPSLDDSAWPRVPFEIFNATANADCRHAFLRRTFTVPTEWKNGEVRLFARVSGEGSFREYLDGNPFFPASVNDDCGGVLKPGTRHCLVVESWGDTLPTGPSTPVFLSYRPNPIATKTLDNWAYAPDRLRFGAPHPLPVTTPSGGALRTVVNVPASDAGRSVFLHVDANCDDLIVNGHSSRGGYSNVYSYYDANVTPWITFGARNTIVATFQGASKIANPRFEYYDKLQYPP